MKELYLNSELKGNSVEVTTGDDWDSDTVRTKQQVSDLHSWNSAGHLFDVGCCLQWFIVHSLVNQGLQYSNLF